MALTAAEEALVRQLLDQQAAILSLANNEATIQSKLGATKVTLADLAAASSISDSDLLLTRQGTADKSVAASIFAQYMASELGVTPPQFDNDNSLATTAFVQRALGNFTAGNGFAQDETFSAARTGQHLLPNATTITRVYLPSASAAGFTLPSRGEAYHIQNTASQNIAVTPQATDSIFISGASLGAGVALDLPVGSEVTLVRIAGTAWAAFGTGALRGSNDFAKSFASSGYQKLPSGLIVQWGVLTTATVSTNITFPLAFPNVAFSFVCNTAEQVAASPTFNVATALSNTGVTIQYTLNGATSYTVRWIAIGN